MNSNKNEDKWRDEECHAWDIGKYELKLTEQGVNTARPVHKAAYLAAREKAQEEIDLVMKARDEWRTHVFEQRKDIQSRDAEIVKLKNSLEAYSEKSKAECEMIEKRDNLLKKASLIVKVSLMYEKYLNLESYNLKQWLSDYKKIIDA